MIKSPSIILEKAPFPCCQDLLSVVTASSQAIFNPLHQVRDGLLVYSVPCGPFLLIKGKDTCMPGHDFLSEI